MITTAQLIAGLALILGLAFLAVVTTPDDDR